MVKNYKREENNGYFNNQYNLASGFIVSQNI